MVILENIVCSLLNENTVSISDVENAIDKHNRIIIDYNSNGDASNSGARVIEVYAYGLTKAGNPCIRAFQPYGQTTSRVPSWKFFRLDRISAWKPTKQTFDRPADFYYKNLGDFNPNGDETMSVVYKIAQFGEDETNNIPQTPSSQPKTKQDVFKTDIEYRMERLKQQLDNPITLSDIKTGDAFKQFTNDTPTTSGPKTKQDVTDQSTPKQPEIYRTDTERGMDRLKQQLQNPKKIDLTQFDRKPKSKQEKEKELQKLRQTLSDKPISLSDLNKKMKEEPQDQTPPKQPEIYRTDTERGMDRLKQQLQNPKKIDLSRIPKR